MRTTRLLLPALALALLLGGCTGDDGDRGRDDDSAEGPTKVREESAPSDEPTEDPADDGSADPALVACIEGDWTVDPADATALTQAAMDLMGVDAQVAITGGFDMVLGDGTITTTYTGYTTDMTMVMEGQEIRVVTVQDGPATQDFTLAGEILTSTPLDMSAVTFTTTTYLDGVVQPGFDAGVEEGMSSMGAGQGDQRVVCDATNLDMIPVVLGAERDDLAVHLTRR